MTREVWLDSTPLGLLSGPRRRPDVQACQRLLVGLCVEGVRVVIPEIIDYELRRELLRARKKASVARLDSLEQAIEYLPITTFAMRLAAELWAQARRQGQPTAGDNTIDADMILAAQALTLDTTDIVIATTNIGHLSRFVPAELWQTIAP